MAPVLPCNNFNDIFSPPPAVHQLQRYSWSPSCRHQICAKLASLGNTQLFCVLALQSPLLLPPSQVPVKHFTENVGCKNEAASSNASSAVAGACCSIQCKDEGIDSVSLSTDIKSHSCLCRRLGWLTEEAFQIFSNGN